MMAAGPALFWYRISRETKRERDERTNTQKNVRTKREGWNECGRTPMPLMMSAKKNRVVDLLLGDADRPVVSAVEPPPPIPSYPLLLIIRCAHFDVGERDEMHDYDSLLTT